MTTHTVQVVWKPIDTAPKDGIPVWLWNEEWEDADFNPTGVLEGYYQENPDDDLGWIVAAWDACHDCYVSLTAVPTHWAAKVSPSAATEGGG